MRSSVAASMLQLPLFESISVPLYSTGWCGKAIVYMAPWYWFALLVTIVPATPGACYGDSGATSNRFLTSNVRVSVWPRYVAVSVTVSVEAALSTAHELRSSSR